MLTINLVAGVGSRKSLRHTAKEMKIIVRYFLLDRVPLRLDPAGFLFTLSCFALLLSSSTLRRKFDQSSGIIAGLAARARVRFYRANVSRGKNPTRKFD